MISLGQSYFRKFLKDCGGASVTAYVSELEAILSRGTAKTYKLEPVSSVQEERLASWSKGYFKAEDLKQQFPRIVFVFGEARDQNDRWMADVFFTRIPHIRGIYSNRATQHSLPSSAEKELGRWLVGSQAADVFTCKANERYVGTANGLYVYQKLEHLPDLRRLAENSKYTPQGSDLKDLLQSLFTILSDKRSASEPAELPTKGRAVRDFLENCDNRVASSLGREKLQALLQPVAISAEQWLNAGRRGLLHLLGRGRAAR
jgi:hypothetical protein